MQLSFHNYHVRWNDINLFEGKSIVTAIALGISLGRGENVTR